VLSVQRKARGFKSGDHKSDDKSGDHKGGDFQAGSACDVAALLELELD
jgi:hypothetical protein